MLSHNFQNLVMITLDCVRPDFLGCHGNVRVQTPNIDRLSTNGIVFEQAITQAPCTWVSHAGIFTGAYPPFHGLRTPFDRISEKAQTLAEVLSDRGFKSAGFPANDLVGCKTGFSRGFDIYYENYNGNIEHGLSANNRNSWANVLKEGEKWLKSQDAPFFAWFHYLDTHHLQELELPEYYRDRFSPEWQYYEGKISFADDICVGKILSLLEENGFSTNTLVVIFADHGEELGVDGHPRHNNDLSDQVLRVPLIFSSPGANLRPLRMQNQVRTVDIMPSVLALLGYQDSIPGEIDGINLLNSTREQINRGRDSSLAYAENQPNGLAAIRSEEWKFIMGNSCKSLFHLPMDPHETRNVLSRNPLTGKFLEEKVLKIQNGKPEPLLFTHTMKNETPWTSEGSEDYIKTVDALKSLGYM